MSWFNPDKNPSGFDNFLSTIASLSSFLQEKEKEAQEKEKEAEIVQQQQQEVILLLGMVYSSYDKPSRGQLFRDRSRIKGLESLGYNVYTLDHNHLSSIRGSLDKHLSANFADSRRMIRSLKKLWNDLQFDHITFDYFYSPVKFTYIKLYFFSEV